MPYTFTHITFSWIFGKIYGFFKKNNLGRLGWALLFFGAILPDSDYLLHWTILPGFHRTFTHSLLMIPAIFIVSYLFFRFVFRNNSEKKKKILFYSGLLTFGVFTHIFLDFLVSFQAGVPLFWPNMNLYGAISGVVPYDQFLQFNFNDPDYLHSKIRWMIFDMALGVSFLFYLIWKKKVKEF